MTLRSILKKKSLGILVHPSSLPGGSYCGTFGEGAKDWIKILSKHRINFWQFLPLTPTDSTGSPYSSPSSFALNPWFLDINELIKSGFISLSKRQELQSINQKEDHFNFDFANNLSRRLSEYLLIDWESQSSERKNDFYLWNRGLNNSGYQSNVSTNMQTSSHS